MDVIVHTYNTSTLETEGKGLWVQVNVDYTDSQKMKMNIPTYWPCLTSIENTLYSLDLLIPNPLFLHLSFHNGKNSVTVWKLKARILGELNGTLDSGNQGLFVLLERNGFILYLLVRNVIQMKCWVFSNLNKFIYIYTNVQKLLLLFSELEVCTDYIYLVYIVNLWYSIIPKWCIYYCEL